MFQRIASARASSAGMSLSLSLLRMVTVGDTTSTSFIPASISAITLPAVGAQDPFSTIATLRLQ